MSGRMGSGAVYRVVVSWVSGRLGGGGWCIG